LNNPPVHLRESPPPVQEQDMAETNRPQAKQRKIYKNLNIEVATLSGLQNGRAASAAAFRTKRLAKVHRESPIVNLIHAEKLIAAGK